MRRLQTSRGKMISTRRFAKWSPEWRKESIGPIELACHHQFAVLLPSERWGIRTLTNRIVEWMLNISGTYHVAFAHIRALFPVAARATARIWALAPCIGLTPWRGKEGPSLPEPLIYQYLDLGQMTKSPSPKKRGLEAS